MPVSPCGQYFNSFVLSVSILCALEFEVPISIDDSQTFPLLKDVFLPVNPRFSSIMVEAKKGARKWKRVEVNLKDHVKVPVFPKGLSPALYQDHFNDYFSKIAMDQLPQNRPLWEIHIIKYPTTNASGHIIFELHHALGDGYSLMGALLSSTQRADNPSFPLTFPSRQSQSQRKKNGEKVGNIFRHVGRIFSGVFETLLDFGESIVKSGLDDDRTPIHSGTEGLEFRPKVTTKMTFSLNQLEQIKDNLNVATSRFIKGTLEKSSITITNMIGPIEKISMANHPVSGFYYIIGGCPQSLVVTMVSYMGKQNVVFATGKGLIDTEKYKSCIESAFQMTLKATGHSVS